MKLIKRPPCENDQENTQKAYELIINVMNENKHIEPTIWANAVWSVLVNGYKQCNFSYKDFLKEVKKVCIHYRKWWK